MNQSYRIVVLGRRREEAFDIPIRREGRKVSSVTYILTVSFTS
jgi:hypothetical protein